MASSYRLASQLSGQSDASSTATGSSDVHGQAQWDSSSFSFSAGSNRFCGSQQQSDDARASTTRSSSSSCNYCNCNNCDCASSSSPYAILLRNNKVFGGGGVVAASDRCVATLEAPHGGGGVVSLALAGDLLYSGSDAAGGDIRVWRHSPFTGPNSGLTSAGERLRARGDGGGAVKALVPVQGRLYSAHQDRKLRVWKRQEQQQQQGEGEDGSSDKLMLAGTLPTLKDYVVSFLPPSNYVRVRRHHKALWIKHADTVSVLVAGAGVLYSASWDKSIKVWRLSDHKCLESLLAHDDAVNALAVDQSNAFLYSGGADAKIKVWARILPDGSSIPFTTPLATPSTPCQEAVVEEQQENVGRRSDRLLRSQASASNLLSPSLMFNQQQQQRSNGYMSSPADPKMLHSLGGGRGKQHHRFKGTSPLHPHARNRHGSHVLVATLEGHGSAINALALSPDAALLYSASGDASISVWEREDSARHMSFATVLRGHSQAVLSLAVSSPSSSQDNYLLCSGSADATIRVWRRRHSGSSSSQSAHHVCVAVLQAHRGPVKSLALRDDGMFLYSGGMDRDIRVWSLTGLQQTTEKSQLEDRGKASEERENSFSSFSSPRFR